jgi:hypothetical protein
MYYVRIVLSCCLIPLFLCERDVPVSDDPPVFVTTGRTDGGDSEATTSIPLRNLSTGLNRSDSLDITTYRPTTTTKSIPATVVQLLQRNTSDLPVRSSVIPSDSASTILGSELRKGVTTTTTSPRVVDQSIPQQLDFDSESSAIGCTVCPTANNANGIIKALGPTTTKLLEPGSLSSTRTGLLSGTPLDLPATNRTTEKLLSLI